MKKIVFSGSGSVLTGIPEQREYPEVSEEFFLDIPQFARGTYYAAFQKYDLFPETAAQKKFPEGANRFQALAVQSFSECREGGLFFILEEIPGVYLILLPLTGEKTVSWLLGREDGLYLRTGSFGPCSALPKEIPLLSWVRTDDIYRGCHQVWEQALSHPLLAGAARLREEKRYPELFQYLGWCSWEEYKCSINEKILLDAVDTIEKSDIPVRYLLIDDGHLIYDPAANHQYLRSFEPDPEKFPQGFAPILARRNPERIRWMGVWLNFNGYWKGVSRENRLGALNDHLRPVSDKALQPKAGAEHSAAFYDSMLGRKTADGFDFFKVDDQAQNLVLCEGQEDSVFSSVCNARALESFCKREDKPLINCMAHGPASIFNTTDSAVTRCSEDYFAGDLGKARRHLFNSYANMPFLGQTIWGDHDMFHSSDRVSGDIMARSKAISGGPVYLSDAPENFNPEYILPLCQKDGFLIRPLAPAAPVRECIFDNPYTADHAYTVIAPLPGEAAAIACYNLTEPEKPVTAVLSPSLYTEAAALLPSEQKCFEMPEEGLLLYDWKTGTPVRFDREIRTLIPAFGDLFYLLIPVKKGWGMIGRRDKYLSPAAVEVIRQTENELVVDAKEACSFLFYSGCTRLSAEGGELLKLKETIWECRVNPQSTDYIVRITTSV